MICERCDGTGLVYFQGVSAPTRPCPVCGGTGRDHCCSGDQPSARDLEEDGGEASES